MPSSPPADRSFTATSAPAGTLTVADEVHCDAPVVIAHDTAVGAPSTYTVVVHVWPASAGLAVRTVSAPTEPANGMTVAAGPKLEPQLSPSTGSKNIAPA